MESWSREHCGFNHETEHLQELCRSLGGNIIKLSDGLTIAAELEDENTLLSAISLDDAIELAGGFVHSRGPFNVYCEEANIYEVWTSDYIFALSSYLFDRSNEDTLIIEVGAGDGLLSKFLLGSMKMLLARRQVSEKLARDRSKRNRRNNNISFTLPEIVATDDGSWSIPTKSEVKALSVSNALKTFCNDKSQKQHVIILCAWMPQGVDWTAEMRKFKVDEYILIGETDNGSCGNKWLTWGNPKFRPDDDDTIDAPFRVDGYERQNLSELSKLQLSRYDGKNSRSSSTVSFRKSVT